MHKKNTIQVFEHQLLRIGEAVHGVVFTLRHFEALTAFAERNSEKYYTLQHKGVRFANYVGALQVGDLTIEILPKIDQVGDSNVQNVLLDLLRACRILQPESIGGANLALRGGSLLDLYLSQFLTEVDLLLHEGLVKTYEPVATNRRALKGRLLMHKQLQYNRLHQERFFTMSIEQNYTHLYNRLLLQAVLALERLPVRPDLQFIAKQLRYRFPEFDAHAKVLPDFQELTFDRQTKRYENAVRTALLILKQFQPDVRAGQLPVLAILFDMNALFEEYIYRQLLRASDQKVKVQRQVRRSFWERRYLQPDILLEMNNQRIILDTKWKHLKKVNPEMDDLRQMFVYNQYFDARNSVLVYPQARALRDLAPVPFQSVPGNTATYFCQVVFIELVKNNILNHQIGKELIRKIR